MSAWIVNHAHIDALVNAAIARGLTDVADRNTVGQMLWKENHRSVNYRYDERTRTPHYSCRTTEQPLHPVAMLKVLDCYEYQTCERPDWPKSKAYEWCAKLRASLEADDQVSTEIVIDHTWTPPQATAAWRLSNVYSDTPWGISRMEQIPVAVH